MISELGVCIDTRMVKRGITIESGCWFINKQKRWLLQRHHFLSDSYSSLFTTGTFFKMIIQYSFIEHRSNPYIVYINPLGLVLNDNNSDIPALLSSPVVGSSTNKNVGFSSDIISSSKSSLNTDRIC
ncbi:hypothetical protein DERP_013623 [Dermatophagoides pteronyssinus]|uniref:Uncharacterized protein n=1 Tax=Dermatophagoides pteronyssinus TaxID=6956 RepID=A0ABQ8IQK0_DERPT|nr:hypothetical protein DERP_013623 [Dermatophagoides pteronyssinus]